MFVPRLGQASTSIIHQWYADVMAAIETVDTKLAPTEYLKECSAAVKAIPLPVAKHLDWRAIAYRIGTPLIGNSVSTIDMYVEKIRGRQQLLSAVQFLKSHPKKNLANQKRLYRMLSSQHRDGSHYYLSLREPNNMPTMVSVSPLFDKSIFR